MAKSSKKRKAAKAKRSKKKKGGEYFPPDFRIKHGSGGFRAARKARKGR